MTQEHEDTETVTTCQNLLSKGEKATELPDIYIFQVKVWGQKKAVPPGISSHTAQHLLGMFSDDYTGVTTRMLPVTYKA